MNAFEFLVTHGELVSISVHAAYESHILCEFVCVCVCYSMTELLVFLLLTY